MYKARFLLIYLLLVLLRFYSVRLLVEFDTAIFGIIAVAVLLDVGIVKVRFTHSGIA